MKKIIKIILSLIVILLLIFLFAYFNYENEKNKLELPSNSSINNSINQSTTIECTTNTDCMKSGCSSQLCGIKKEQEKQLLLTTCEWKEEYSCYKEQTCGCVNNKCSWEDQNTLSSCLSEYN